MKKITVTISLPEEARRKAKERSREVLGSVNVSAYFAYLVNKDYEEHQRLQNIDNTPKEWRR